MSEPQSDDPTVAALLRERDGLVARGLDDRVAQVDEQLAARGHRPADGPAATPEAPAEKPTPKGRQEKPRSTAAGS